MTSEEYLTTKEVAAMLRVSDQTIRSYVKKGMIPAIKFGTSRRSTVRIPKSGLDQFLASMQSSAVEPEEEEGEEEITRETPHPNKEIRTHPQSGHQPHSMAGEKDVLNRNTPDDFYIGDTPSEEEE